MTGEEVIEKIKSSVGDDIQKGEVHLGDAVIFVSPENLHKIAQFLKEDPDLRFEYLSDIRGVDYLDQEREPRYESIYELQSFEYNHSVRIRVASESGTLPGCSICTRTVTPTPGEAAAYLAVCGSS